MTAENLLNLKDYITQAGSSAPELIAPEQLDPSDASSLAEVGVLLDGHNRAGTFVMQDFHPVCSFSAVEGLEVMPLALALARYEWLKDHYYWKLVKRDQDEVTRYCADQPTPQGFFIHVREGAKVELPYQAALYMAHANIAQAIHNVVLLDDNAELNLITGCATHHSVTRGIHMAITETYIGKNATLTNTMVHSWGPEVTVMPRAGTAVGSGGRFISNYVSLRPAGTVQSNPTTWLKGKDSSAKYQTIILGAKGSDIQTGGVVYLDGENSRAELTHRGVCTGGQMIQGGMLIGNAPCRAHIDCSGMLLDPGQEGFIQSTPGLKAFHPEAQMSHEASIGKIAPEQVEYLQSRGISERDAISMIIRGFLNADIEGLGRELDARIAEIADLAGHGEE